MSRICRSLIILTVLGSISLPAWGQAHRRPGTDNAVRFHLGLFEPDGSSQYWQDKEFDFTGDENDFDDVIGGVDFIRTLGPRLGAFASVSAWEGQADQSYIDFVDESGFRIVHTTTLEISSVELGLLLRLAGDHAAVVPYFGVAGGMYFWRLTESGDFIDFESPDLPIFFDTFVDEGEDIGLAWILGLEVPISRGFAFFAEGRWRSVDDDLGGDFEGLGRLDLSGRSLSAGASWRF